MDRLLEKLKNCSKINNFNINILTQENAFDNFVKIYDENWEQLEEKELPYEIITQLMDAYMMLPERPDLAFLFTWEAINNSYNTLSYKDTSIHRLMDKKGMELLCEKVSDNWNFFAQYMGSYIENIPIKVFRFVASYILKGLVIENINPDDKFVSSSYISFKKSYTDLFEAIRDSYGEKYKELFTAEMNQSGKYDVVKKSNLIISDKVISDKEISNKSRKIVGNLALKLSELIKVGRTNFSKTDGNNVTFNLNEASRFKFIIIMILYATRCSNFHGNVASRLNSNYANKETYYEYRFIFLMAHTILGIALYINGYLSEKSLNDIKTNETIGAENV